MQVLRRLPRTSVGINMTPMIDVVFLLIIFFLVSSHLAQREQRIQVELPDAFSGRSDRPSETPRVTLTLQENGRIWLGSQPVSVEQLAQRLRAEQRQHGERLELRVRCDRRLPYREVEPVLSAAAQSGLWNVSFAVLQSTERRP